MLTRDKLDLRQSSTDATFLKTKSQDIRCSATVRINFGEGYQCATLSNTRLATHIYR
jgi:hypothetical protein